MNAPHHVTTSDFPIIVTSASGIQVTTVLTFLSASDVDADLIARLAPGGVYDIDGLRVVRPVAPSPRDMRRILRDASTVARWLDRGCDDADEDFAATRDGGGVVLRGYDESQRSFVDVTACACSACGEPTVFDLVIEVGGVEVPVCGGCFGEADVAVAA
jgi:hypothetical protein